MCVDTRNEREVRIMSVRFSFLLMSLGLILTVSLKGQDDFSYQRIGENNVHSGTAVLKVINNVVHPGNFDIVISSSGSVYSYVNQIWCLERLKISDGTKEEWINLRDILPVVPYLVLFRSNEEMQHRMRALMRVKPNKDPFLNECLGASGVVNLKFLKISIGKSVASVRVAYLLWVFEYDLECSNPMGHEWKIKTVKKISESSPPAFLGDVLPSGKASE
jgi:hypothetical protein